MAEPLALQQADEFIAFLRGVNRFKLRVEIALMVDNQVCDSTFSINPRTEHGMQVLEYLTQTAIGARLKMCEGFWEGKPADLAKGPEFGL